MKTIIISLCVLLTGCASQQWAQNHWQWLNEGNTGAKAYYNTGVVISNIQVNGQTYQVTTPAR